jgi:hypothetical protein
MRGLNMRKRHTAGRSARITRIAGTVLAAAALLLTACDNPINILNEIEVEYKRANDLFLVVEDFSPASNAFNVNPGAEILIDFDRPVNLDSVTDVTLKIYDASFSEVGWTFSRYNSTTYTLYIKGAPFFSDTTEYTISVKGIEGRDGEVLQEDVSWTFVTGSAPAGDFVSIDSTNGNSQDGFTNLLTVNLDLEGNGKVDRYMVSNSASAVDVTDGAFVGASTTDPWYDYSGPVSITPWTLAGGADGTRTIYALFAEDDGLGGWKYSLPKEISITYDNTDPTVSAGVDRSRSSSIYHSGTASDANGIQSYQWTVSGGGVSFGTPTKVATTMVGSGSGVDYNRTVTLTVMDLAGNTNSDSMIFNWDTLAPNAPVFDNYIRFAHPYNAYRRGEELAFYLGINWSQGGGDGVDRYLFESPDRKSGDTGTSLLQWRIPDEFIPRSGFYTFQVLEVDALGNKSDATKMIVPYFFDRSTDDPRQKKRENEAAQVSPFFFNQDNKPLDLGSTNYFSWPPFYPDPANPDPRDTFNYRIVILQDDLMQENADFWLEAVGDKKIDATNFDDPATYAMVFGNPFSATEVFESADKYTYEWYYSVMWQGNGLSMKDTSGFEAIRDNNSVYYWYYEIYDQAGYEPEHLLETSPYYVFVSY